MTRDDVIKIIDGIPFYNYDYIGFLYNKLQEKDKELDRLNKCFIYLEKHFSKRQQYEDAEIVRQLKEANIEWLNQGIDCLQNGSDDNE